MSSSFSFRPVPLVPFLAADGVLLLTAMLIAWRTPGEIAGGALLAVVVCVVLGAVLAVLPWVLNDAREREAALAERQRELVELVNTSTASAARWGTQWAAAATGLEDAAQLASRSIATAERLPAVLQEKAEALVARLAAVEREASARVEKTAQLEAATGARAEQMNATAEEFQRTVAEALSAVQQVRAAREELDGRAAEMPALADAQAVRITRVAGEAEARLGATVEALNLRLAELDAKIGDAVAKLDRVAAVPVVAAVKEPSVAQPVAVVAERPKVVMKSEAIMDPFLIPEDGYASLAEAMDARKG